MSEPPKVKLHEAQRQLMKLIEKQNLERAAKLQRMKRFNFFCGWTLGGIALGIYAYSLAAVKQETFLDDFNPPERVAE